MKKPIITFENFTFQYHSQTSPTLNDINLTIFEGEKIAVIGASGSGKSTFARCINGLIPHTFEGEFSGNVTINQKALTESSLFDLSFEVGTVLQDTDGQFIGLTVGEDVAFILENDEMKQEKMKAEVTKWTNLVGINNFLEFRPQDLSGGQKQRVSMAGILISEPKIILFDEPLANLDPKSGKEAIELINQLHQQTKNTTIIIEHRLEDVLHSTIDRIIVFDRGSIVADLPADELLKTDILKNQGIREPLYITAMKYAGINMNEVDYLSDGTKVTAPNLKERIEKWTTKNISESTNKKEKTLLELKNITYQYDELRNKVLDDISVTFYKGEMVSIVGQNGAGKSTLCKVICGFVKPQKGTMTFANDNFSDFSIKERAEKIGFVMQNPNQMISKKIVFDEVAFGLELKGIPDTEIKMRVEKILKICGLFPFRNWPISALSFGQKKRVTIAAILVLEPEMIILDEPTAGQDYRHYTQMMSFLVKLNQLGITVAMITHDMYLMQEYTKRSVVLCDGQIIADTSPTNVLTNPNLVDKASLKETSLFSFAKEIGIEDAVSFTENFIEYERRLRIDE